MDSDSDASESPEPRAPAVTATIRGSLLRQTCTATLNTALKIRFAAALVQRKGLPGQATPGQLPPPALPPPPGLAWDDADPGPRTRGSLASETKHCPVSGRLPARRTTAGLRGRADGPGRAVSRGSDPPERQSCPRLPRPQPGMCRARGTKPGDAPPNCQSHG